MKDSNVLSKNRSESDANGKRKIILMLQGFRVNSLSHYPHQFLSSLEPKTLVGRLTYATEAAFKSK